MRDGENDSCSCGFDSCSEITNVSDWMKDYSKKAGTKGFVIGLSGGIDSSVMACLSVKAAGRENVIGVSLPIQTRKDMVIDAERLASNLCIKLVTINLEKTYNETIEAMLQGGIVINDIVQANVKARLRMTALYGVANSVNYLVAGTGNLSELMVGYCTKYGDGGVDVEPIGNYYKAEVYKLAELMPEIPNNVITKAPSADLWEGQTDEEELGMTYDELDEILKALASGNSSELDKIDIDRIAKVEKMIQSAKHKNKPPPRYIRN